MVHSLDQLLLSSVDIYARKRIRLHRIELDRITPGEENPMEHNLPGCNLIE